MSYVYRPATRTASVVEEASRVREWREILMAFRVHAASRPFVRVDVGGCLDAPETMPAGACFQVSIGPGEDDEPVATYMAEQFTWRREA